MNRDAQRILLIAGAFLLLACGAYYFFFTPNRQTHPEEAQLHVNEPGAAYWESPKGPLSREEEAVIISTESGNEVLPVKKVLFEYIEVVGGCSEHFGGECVNVRTGPGTDFPAVMKLRNHIVFKVGGKIERDEKTWIKIIFDETLRYPERVTGDWYVAADYVRVVLDEGNKDIEAGKPATTTKRIIVDRSDQTLVAYDGDTVFLETLVSTGLELTPTPRGTFTVFKKTPSRYMQGPLPGVSDQYYDLPGVPWNLYFSHEGAVIHGAYWHDSFGSPYSHGCVNLPYDKAKELYDWADLGTTVIIKE